MLNYLVLKFRICNIIREYLKLGDMEMNNLGFKKINGV